MTPIPVPHRWLAALLGAALLVDLMLSGTRSLSEGLPPMPGAVALCVCAYLALTRPMLGALVGAGVLLGSSLVILATDSIPVSMGIPGIVLSEVVAGATLVVLVVWRCTPAVAAACVVTLVIACLVAMGIRSVNLCLGAFCPTPFDVLGRTDIYRGLLLGLLVLAGAVTIGVYLRHVGDLRMETPTDILIRKQWPLGVALAVLLLIEAADAGYSGLASLLGSGAAALCAFVAPRAPLRYALLGAASLTLLPLIFGVLSGGQFLRMSYAGLAASMAMIAYAVRYLPRRRAIVAVGTLSAANVVSVALRDADNLLDADIMLLLGLLLVIAMATGWYFRARDRERKQTVRAAVTSAQQGERMALARELHDVVAHHVTGIVVQAQAALLVAGQNPGAAVTALEKIEHSGGEALTAMRTLVGSLRDGTAAWTAGDAEATGQATTDLDADIRTMVENFVGPPVELELNLPEQLPHEVGRSVLRLVQESLTNVGKHAPDADDVRVRVVALGDELHIRVVDNGSGRPLSPVGGSGGYGLVGMRERVELLGGRFEAGPSGFVGWSVEAWLPLTKQ